MKSQRYKAARERTRVCSATRALPLGGNLAAREFRSSKQLRVREDAHVRVNTK